ncbi:hypothetical protein BDV27DRAFT_114745 [Aspergillus caelatus]|uniref:Uncharacterized protein n=1 Tax=Aspergillus caelatus TaxID=61420 RepID=A0A5N7A3F0_9EURO|nr:uncharacterized protein BDV27DRAFT_114745 [Aspergillus caelatus]KAE8364394.1 hypothetical protein BDV27DRAFT_114745 [Aspergillus caelatus]
MEPKSSSRCWRIMTGLYYFLSPLSGDLGGGYIQENCFCRTNRLIPTVGPFHAAASFLLSNHLNVDLVTELWSIYTYVHDQSRIWHLISCHR